MFFLFAFIRFMRKKKQKPIKIITIGTLVPNDKYVVLNKTIAKKSAIIKTTGL